MIIKGCAIMLAVFGAVFAGYFWVLRDIEFPGNLLLSLFGAAGLLMLISALKQMIFGEGNGAAFKRALQGAPLQEGETEAVWGPIHPLGELLVAPFSGESCVAYEYDAKNPEVTGSKGGRRPQGSKFAGFALTPSVIRSNRGNVNLLGFNMLTNFPEMELRRFEDPLERAKRFLDETQFEQMGITKIGTLLSEMGSVIADDDGSVRKDWLMTDKASITLEASNLSEKRVAAGDIVTAIGIWDPARRGLVPKLGNKSVIVSLRPGGGEAMVAAASKRPWALLAFSLVWSGFVHLFIYIVLSNAPR
jgi:hypothetical protein